MTRPMSRRRFLTAAAGLQVGLFAAHSGARRWLALVGADGAPDLPGGAAAQGAEDALLSAYVRIAPSGAVTIAAPVPDIGQGVRTSLAMLVAEELEARWDDVTVVQAPAGAEYGRQGIGGSGTIRGYHQDMRRAGATARTMLVAAAAARWGVPEAECRAREGAVEHPGSGRRLGYGELAAEAAALPLPGTPALKDRADFRLIGQDVPRVDNADVVTGRAGYGLDARPEGLRFAVVARPPALGAVLEGYDEAAALATPGVEAVVPGVGGGVAVVARTTWDALQGRDALAARWDDSANADLDSAAIAEALAGGVTPPEPPAGVARPLRATFELPYLAHAAMEPMNCTVRTDGEAATVWAPTQSPQGVRRSVAGALGLPESAVTVIPTLAGGGFGRRASTDYAVEAGQVAREVGGAIQLVWTREDDLCHDAYRPASCHHLAAGVDGSGQPLGWVHRWAGATQGRQLASDERGAADAAERPYARDQFGGRPTYTIPGFGAERSRVSLPVPTMVWRSVDHSQVVFANECFVDMLAEAAGADPLAFRLAHLNEPRLRPLLERAAERIGWRGEREPGRGFGLACFAGYGSFVAQAAEVSVSPQGAVRVERVVCVVDCGLAINPSSIRAQMEGCVADAVSTTLHAEITVSGGRIEQRGFWGYRWLRIDGMPRVEVELVDSDEGPGGMGELGYPAVSPAICNAIFAATGRRIHRLPLRAEDLAGWPEDPGAPGPPPTLTPQPEPTPTATATTEPTEGRIYLPRVLDEG